MTPEIQAYIDKAVQDALAFSTPKYGDTPTDVLQLANKKYVDSHTFAGAFSSTGTALNLPRGWTVTKNSTGNYTVTHNIGNASYSVVATTTSDLAIASAIPSLANSFTIVVRSLTGGGVPVDASTFFILAMIV